LYLTDLISSGPHGTVLLVPVSRTPPVANGLLYFIKMNIMTGGNKNVLLLPHYDQYIKKIRCKNCTDEPMPQALVTRNYPLFQLDFFIAYFQWNFSSFRLFFLYLTCSWSSSYSLMKTAAWKWLSNRKNEKKRVYFNVTIYMCITKDISNLWQTRLMVIK
jgi:hypothetical protein